MAVLKPTCRLSHHLGEPLYSVQEDSAHDTRHTQTPKKTNNRMKKTASTSAGPASRRTGHVPRQEHDAFGPDDPPVHRKRRDRRHGHPICTGSSKGRYLVPGTRHAMVHDGYTSEYATRLRVTMVPDGRRWQRYHQAGAHDAQPQSAEHCSTDGLHAHHRRQPTEPGDHVHGNHRRHTRMLHFPHVG